MLQLCVYEVIVVQTTAQQICGSEAINDRYKFNFARDINNAPPLSVYIGSIF